MNEFVEPLQGVRKRIDQLVTKTAASSEPCLDDLLGNMNMYGTQYYHADQFVNAYFELAKAHITSMVAIDQKLADHEAPDPGSFPRLVYNSLVPAAALGLVTSSIGGAIVGFIAGLGVDIVSQRYWKNVASPANTGWWMLVGGVAGVAVDYFADTSMPIFTYIISAATGTLSGIVEASEVVHRETPKSLRERQREVHMWGRKHGDELVQKYARIIEGCE